MRGGDFYAALVWLVLGLVALAVVALAGLLARHVWVAARLRSRAQRSRALLPLVCRAVDAPEGLAPLLAQLRRGDREVLLSLLLPLALDLRGEERERVARIAEAAGLARAEQRRLQRGRAIARAQAAKNLGLLGARAALPELLERLRGDADPRVRTACAAAVAAVGGPAAVQGLVERLDDPAPRVVRRAQEALLDEAPGAVAEIVRHARETRNPTARCAAVELLGALRDPAASEALLEWMGDPDPELRTKATKAAAAIADPRSAAAFRALLRDGAWTVRCQAATGLGATGGVQAIAPLVAALTDPAWWVRFNAASALAELGGAGRTALAVASSDAERPRREVARYVLQRAGLAA
jgi:HEAT repeat protein